MNVGPLEDDVAVGVSAVSVPVAANEFWAREEEAKSAMDSRPREKRRMVLEVGRSLKGLRGRGWVGGRCELKGGAGGTRAELAVDFENTALPQPSLNSYFPSSLSAP